MKIEKTARLKEIKEELRKRGAFEPRFGIASVPSDELHGKAILQQSAPPALEDLIDELDALEALEEEQDLERIAVLRKAIAARTNPK